MARFSPVPIRERYANTALRREEGGRNVLVNLPKKGRGELEHAARMLAGQSCRECSSCCSGGFSFTKEDPHFEEIMGGMRADGKKFVVRKSGNALSKERTFLVFVPFGKKACGFLDGQAEIYSELHFAEPLSMEEGVVFGCGLYATRPSICKSYPFVWDFFDGKNQLKGGDNSFAAIDPSCLVMWKLGNQGIGHFTLSEIEFMVENGGNGGESMLSSLWSSLAEIKRRVEAKKAWGKIFRTEEGEEVYPLNYNETSHPN